MRHSCDILARGAALSPRRTALIDASTGVGLTYAALRERAARAAGFLASRGVGRGDRVGVLAANSVALVELLLASGRLGAILVPLNTRLAGPELAGLVQDAAPAVLLHDGPHAGLAAATGFPDTAPLESLAAYDGPPAPGVTVTTEDPWIICYTGGTTGTPKGAVLTHGTVLWNAMNTICGWGLREDDVAPVFTPLHHTGGLNVLMTPLLYMGGTSVIVPAFDADLAFDVIAEHRATYVFMVPAMYRMMMRSPRWSDEAFGSVRDFVTGGAPCPADVHEAFGRKGRRFRVGYGLTEAGPNNFHIDPAQALEHPGSIGRPLPFVQARIDGASRPGDTGELLLRGPHVFAGYWNRPDETARVLEGGWLRTGDAARQDDEGRFHIAGRLKEMYISGGENVYPAEVEQALLDHPAVADAAVVGIPDERWGETGLAAVVIDPGREISGDELAAFAAERIARYKVPRRFLLLDELPRTGAGKTDKKRIAEMARTKEV